MADMGEDPNGQDPVDFTAGGAGRIIKATRFIERNYRLPPPPRRKYPVGTGGGGMRKAVLTTSLTARSGSTPGTGSFKFRKFDGTAISTGTDVFTVRSDFTTSIASGKVIWVTFAEGVWWLVVGDC